MITYQTGDIFASTAQTIVNPVNLVGVMGAGLAKECKDRYPAMFASYKRMCDEKKFHLGMLQLWKGPQRWILNFPTKTHWQNNSQIDIIEAGLFRFTETFEERGIKSIAFPRLGCGKGNLSWKEVLPLMEKYLDHLPINVEIYVLDD